MYTETIVLPYHNLSLLQCTLSLCPILYAM